MSNSTVDLVSDLDGEILFSYIIGTFSNSHLPHLGRNQLESEIIPLSDDSDSKWVFENFFEEGTSSSDSLEAILLNVGSEVNHVETLMPPIILTGEEMQASRQKREHTKDYIQIRLKADNYKHNNDEVKAHFDLPSLSDVEKLD